MTQNLPAKSEKEMVYTMANGDEMKLTMATVRKYLVQGKSEYVTDSELLFFMHECKARKLNPFLRQSWLIKYSQTENAQIIEAIHHKRAKARAAPDCRGWKKGLILQDAKGQIRKSKGMVLEGETVLGAFFEATPEGWNVPYELEINLSGYIKKKKDGSITKFWAKENQPSQIMKVVESQGLSALWGDTIGTAYIPEELPEAIDFELSKDGMYEEGHPKSTAGEFDRLAMAKIDLPDPTGVFVVLSSYLNEMAGDQEPVMTIEQFKTEAVAQFDELWTHFEQWRKSQNQPSLPGKKKKAPEMIDYGGPWDQSKWWRKREGDGVKSGFGEFVYANIDTFPGAPVPLQGLAIDEWNDFYKGKPFPTTEAAKGADETKAPPKDAPGTDKWIELGNARESFGDDVYTQACEAVFGEPERYPQDPNETQSVIAKMGEIAEGGTE